MNRPYSWYPLATSDPVPGEPVVVRAGGDHYRRVASAIADAESTLRTLVAAQDAVSEAVDAIRDRTRAVADRIREAHARYDAAGDALVGYSIQLDLAQSESLAALHTAQAAQRTADVADDAVRRWARLLDDATDTGQDTTTQQRALTAARTERTDAEAAVAQARTALEEAVARRDVAARTAMDSIDAGTQDTLHDGWWEDWGADVAQIVSTWAGHIATGAGLLTLFLGWVPVLGQVLAIVAVVAGAAALAADIALAVKRGDGQDWFNVAMGVVGLLTFGAGRALGQAVKAFEVSARTASSQATKQLAASVIGRVASRFSRARPAAARPGSLDALSASSPVSTNQLRAAWERVVSVRGVDRMLALAGHGDLVAQNNALRAQLWDAFPWHPKAFITLIGPAVRGASLEAGAAVLYVGDATMAFTSIVRSTSAQIVGPRPDAASRLGV